MHCSMSFGLWLQLAILYGEPPRVAAYPDPMITSPPQLAKRNGELIGYYSADNSYSPFLCNGAYSLTQSDYYMGCVDPKASSTSLDQLCPTSTLLNFCAGDEKCVALNVLPSKGSIITYTWVGCLIGGDIPDNTVYQTLPSSTVPSTTSTTCCPAPTPPPTPSPSLAWIAGPIIGGLVGLAAIGFLVWFIMRRRKRRAEESVASSPAFTTAAAPKAPGSPSFQSTFYSPTYPSMSSPVQATSPPNFSPPPQFAPPSQSQWQPPAQEMSAQHSPDPPSELGTTPASFSATGGWKY